LTNCWFALNLIATPSTSNGESKTR
jgi:hypothetical protein